MSVDAVPTARRRGAAIGSGQRDHSRQPLGHRAQQLVLPLVGSAVRV